MILGTMEIRFRYYVNDSNTIRFSQAEAYYYINEAYKYYHGRLVSCGYNSLLATTTTLDITADTNTIALPSDFLRARLLERVDSNGWYVMYDYEKDSGYIEDTDGATGDYIPEYSFQGTNLVLIPTPTESVSDGIRLTYWPVATEMSDSTDTPESGFNSTWHGLIPLLAAINAKAGREEQDALPLINILDKMEQPFNDMIDRMTVARQTAEPFCTGRL